MTPDQQRELCRFPAALRMLVESELAVGNSIVEVGQSYPAPPAGAFVKLAKQVSTRLRASGTGLQFYERQSSIYSGEFSDAKRFYFVLEPPLPPPEPDSNAIRSAPDSRLNASSPITLVNGLQEVGPTTNVHENSARVEDADSDSVEAIQLAIIEKFKSGAYYRTSHKEGGTNIFWRGTRFVRSDFGDDPMEQTFEDESKFLQMLDRLCNCDVVENNGGAKLPECDQWRKILSRLH
jgi:hypothetical protein